MALLRYWNEIVNFWVYMELRGGSYLSRGFDLYSACATGLAAWHAYAYPGCHENLQAIEECISIASLLALAKIGE